MKYQRQDVQLIQQYKNLFNPQQQNIPNMPPQPNLQQVLANALDTRKFEIELYWKRAYIFGHLLQRHLQAVLHSRPPTRFLLQKSMKRF